MGEFPVGHVGVHDNMVICAIVGCGSRTPTPRDKEKNFYRLPSILIHQGTQTESLSRERQQAWLAKIKREDILPEQYYNIRVCSDHFVSIGVSRAHNIPGLLIIHKSIDIINSY